MSNVLFKNANLMLDGRANLETGFDVLVRGNRIDTVSPAPVEPASAKVIDASGKTLMPGLIDAHAHVTGLT